jgi:hypothetical protein
MFPQYIKKLSSKRIKEMFDIDIIFGMKTWKKNNGYNSYGSYICECT